MMSESKIVDIPVKMEKFYGKGTMLHPNLEVIEEEIKKIPKGKAATIESLCNKLSMDFGTNVTCPMRTGNGIKKIAEQMSENTSVPYWRLIRTDQQVIQSKVYEMAAAKLEDEGFVLTYLKSGKIKVQLSEERYYHF